MPQPLAGTKVLDFTHLLPGEVCSTMLSDLGCEVVRVEPLIPGLASKLPPIVEGESLYYWSVHRNKTRLAVDLKSAEGNKIVQLLIRNCDILLENFRPGVMKRLGINYTEARKLNRKIIYCSISGYGHETSWSDRPGHDLNFIAESGVLDATCTDEGRPVLPGALISDYMAASYGALAVVAALFDRRRSRRGKHIDISMFEAALSTQQIMATALLYLGLEKAQAPFRYPSELPNYTVYRCQDLRYIAVAPLEGTFWATFCQIIGLPELAETEVDPGDKALPKRLAAVFAQRTLPQWLEVFEGKYCCVSPVNTISEALNTVPARERLALTYLEHPRLGMIPQIASPMLSKQERRRKNIPVATADNAALRLLKDLGYTRREIDRLADRGIIALRPPAVAAPEF